jgi:hypothetical protein
LVRTKKRVSYFLRKQARLWRVDFTEVTPKSLLTGETRPVEYELEFEMPSAVSMEWLSATKPDVIQKLTQELTASLLYLIRRLIPSLVPVTNNASHVFRKQDVLNGTPLYTAIQRVLVAQNQSLRPSGKELQCLGSLPINLYRKSLEQVLRNDYFVTEKTDGIRYLMYTASVPDSSNNYASTSLLLNRDRSMSTFSNAKSIAMALGDNCILDGEVVYSKVSKRHEFLVFDVLMINNVSLATFAFSERQKRLRQLLNDDVLEALNGDLKDDDLAVRNKLFFPKDDISILIERFQEDPLDGEMYFMESGEY